MRFVRAGVLSAVVCAVFLSLVFVGSASAIVTSSQITTPSNPSFPLGETGTTMPVSGTAENLTEVNIDCYSGPLGFERAVLAQKVPVVSGLFSTTVPVTAIPGGVCQLRAVPITETGSLPPGEKELYEGPLIAPSSFAPEGTTNFVLKSSSIPFSFELEGAGAYALESTAFVAPLHERVHVFYGVGAMRVQPVGTSTRASLQVDGVDAFAPDAARQINAKATGLPAITVSHSIDPATHQAAITEEDPIVVCSPGGVYPPTEVSCPGFTSAGITLVREWRTSSEDRLASLTDSWRWTSGASHKVDIRYYTEMQGAKEGGSFQFPGEGAYAKTKAGEAKTLPAGPGVVFYKYNAAAPEAEDPQAAILYDSAPSAAVSVARGSEGPQSSITEVPYVRTVSPGAPALLRFAFAQSFSTTQLGSLASAALGGFVPSLAISSPANGTSTSSPTVTVTGSASDTGVLTGLTVNGVPVTVGAGGAWSTSVTLKAGANTITATATDQAGLSRSAAITVTYVPAAPPPPPSEAKVKSIKAGKGKVTMVVTCTGPAGGSCTVQGTLTTVEKLNHGKVKSLVAKLRSKTVTVGSRKLTLAVGKSVTLTITLNTTGKKLLARFHRLPLKALVQLIAPSGKKSTVAKATLTLKSPAKKKH